MPRRRRRRGGRGRGGGLETRQEVVEHITFTCPVGATQPVKVQTFNSIPQSRAFRPIRAWVDVTGGHWYRQIVDSGKPLDKWCASGYAPAWCQLAFYNNGGARSCTTGAVLLGPSPRRLQLRFPRSEDWFPADHPAGNVIFAVDCGCIAKPPSGFPSVFVSGIIHIALAIGKEISTESCPTVAEPCVDEEDPLDAVVL